MFCATRWRETEVSPAAQKQFVARSDLLLRLSNVRAINPDLAGGQS